jgi:hypothetical protein
MGTNSENQTDSSGKTPLFRGSRLNRPTPFVVRWHALQRELAVKTSRLDNFLTEISQIIVTPRRASEKASDVSSRFEKSFLSDSIAS